MAYDLPVMRVLLGNGRSKMPLYRKTELVHADSWTPDSDMTNVVVSLEYSNDGSPKPGDMIVTDPDDPEDRWLVPMEKFEGAYELVEEKDEDQTDENAGAAADAAQAGQ